MTNLTKKDTMNESAVVEMKHSCTVRFDDMQRLLLALLQLWTCSPQTDAAGAKPLYSVDR